MGRSNPTNPTRLEWVRGFLGFMFRGKTPMKFNKHQPKRRFLLETIIVRFHFIILEGLKSANMLLRAENQNC